MSLLAALAGALVVGVLVRQLVVLAAIVRSGRFLTRATTAHEAEQTTPGHDPVFFVIVPVLREAAVIAEAVTHFEAVVQGHAAQLVIVTTAREAAEGSLQHDAGDTVTLVERLAAEHSFVHLHYPDPRGLKGDQLNFAAAYCASTLLGEVPASDAFLVCYDADSRPPLDSQTHFAKAAAGSPQASVFHQSSRFELRGTAPQHGGLRSRLSHAVSNGGALRANRFVLGFEIPRLVNRTRAVSAIKRAACSCVYAHVTTHGLCVRLALVPELPFPEQSPLEDMQYSFYLGSRDLPMVAIPSLDCAEVPDSALAQVRQAARWFFGPARSLSYLTDPATRSGWRARLLAVSALGSAVEWLACAVVPAATALLLLYADGLWRATAGALAATYLAQLLLTDRLLGSPAPVRSRIVRMLACPLATTLFGLGGFIGAVRLLRGGSGVGKTERRKIT